VLRRIFGLKREVAGGWRKLHNDELHNFHSSRNIIRMIMSRRMRWAVYVARNGKKSNAYTLSVGKPEGKRRLERPRRVWVYNIKMDLREIGSGGGMNWIWPRIGTSGGLL
jgi:hypothetical protein